MSRIGKEPVQVPSGVEVKIDGLMVTAKGKLGEESCQLTEDVTVTQENGTVTVAPAHDGKPASRMLRYSVDSTSSSCRPRILRLALFSIAR